jgi:hypothetical protein
MALSIFDDKTEMPTDFDLAETLGDSYSIWYKIKEFVFQQYPEALDQWNFSGKNYGWGYRLLDKKRVIVYLTPCENYFKVALVYGQKATDEALLSNISGEIKDIISSAKVYAEGRGFRFDVANDSVIDDIKQLIMIKLKN